MLDITFVMEQHLGHQSYYQNIRRFVDAGARVRATWAPVTYAQPGGLWERLAFLPAGLRGTLRGRAQVRRALAHAGGVVFFNTQVPAALGGRLARRRPYVVATDITPLQYDRVSRQYGHRADRPGPLTRYKHRVNLAVLRGAACLLPWSSWARASLIADYGVEPARVAVLPPGVDLARWTPARRQDPGPLRILFVGGDMRRKGGEALLHAFRALPPGAAELTLVTRSPVAPEPGVRVYHDLRPNAPELLALFQSSDLFVLPTAAEAFGIAAVEASAAGLPVIATAVGGLTDIVADGETGFLIAPGDLAALGARLRLLAGDAALRERMGRAARARAELLFDARANAARLLDHLERAAAHTPEVCYAA